MYSEKQSQCTKTEQNLRNLLPWITVAIIIAITAGLRFRLLDVPLERDEGEYAYAGQLILQGIPPYLHIYNMKMPGIHAAYASILAVFGQTQTGIHLGLLVINTLTIILVFLLAAFLKTSVVVSSWVKGRYLYRKEMSTTRLSLIRVRSFYTTCPIWSY